MLHTISWYRQGIFITLTVLFVNSVWGYEDRGRQRGEQPENSRREQLRQEAQASSSEIDTLLGQILQAVNKNQHPGEDLITQAATMLEENKHFVPAYKDEQKAQYMLLQAWTDFYQGNLPDAMNWSLRACKMDESSQDTWISQAVFCLLNGKRPPEPRISKPEPRRDMDETENRRPGRRRDNDPINNARNASASEPYSRKGTLEFDLSALRSEMLKERFGRLEYKSVDGSKVEYKPGEDTLCIFFWQVEPVRADVEDAGDGANGDVEAMRTGGSGSSQKLNLNSQEQYFSNIYKVLKDRPQITCFLLNTNGLQDAERVATGMEDDFAHEIMDKPVVYAADSASGASAYVGVKAQIPFMLVADKEGIVRYAGPAADFMPAFILSSLTGVEISLDGAQPQATAGRVREFREDLMGMDGLRPWRVTPPKALNHSAADPNRPAGDPNSVPTTGQASGKKIAKPTETPLEGQVTADHLLALAQMEIEACRKIRGKSPEKGIVACREVLKKYPNTEYAQQARELLRRVPPQYKKKYEITDEELGL
ncbi:MAG: hypothetical protein ISS71_00155 [Phycisphaerae bacterium]|nr:hypothetical protein [Phycisphaerae bacterium]